MIQDNLNPQPVPDFAILSDPTVSALIYMFVGSVFLYGSLFFILIIVLRYLKLVTSGGNEKKIKVIKDQITKTHICLTVFLVAYLFWTIIEEIIF